MHLLKLIQQIQSEWKVRSTEVCPDGDGVAALVELELLPGSDSAAATMEVDPSEDLAVALAERERRFGKPPALSVSVRLRRGYPSVPPEFRIVEPVFVVGTGGICNGNLLLPCLWPEGWRQDGGFALSAVLGWARDHVLTHGARLDADSNHYYNLQAYNATRAKLLLRSDALCRHPTDFSRKYCVYGSDFAAAVLGLSLPDGFDAGNKILMPSVSLAHLAQCELEDLRRDPEVSPGDSSASDGGLDLEARWRLIERLRRGVNPGDDFLGGAAMTFALVSVLRFPVFVGVHGFTVPHSDVVIVPTPVLLSLGVPEGSEVTFTRVVLPSATGLELQPHTVNFEAVEAFTERPPREFLEASLTRYACLQTGDVILCDGGPAQPGVGISAGLQQHGFWFTVVSVQPPHAPAVALWADFSAQLPIEFVPPADTFVMHVPRPESLPPAAPASITEEAVSLATGVSTPAFTGVGRTLAGDGGGPPSSAVGAEPAPGPAAAPADAQQAPASDQHERELRRRRAAAAALLRTQQLQ